ncbi:glycosyltransferase family 2 protein [Hirschia litorea]|uniref:Glycosyltransferase family 2 protein n=1 Tax=Hirschia litorea TaxID=1199156 RepID=A0ABW2IP83_9PROT
MKNSTSSGQLSVIIPVYNEADNVTRVVAALDKALVDVSWEVVFVDDHSPDNTSQIITDIAAHDQRVRLIHRVGRRGLSSAVIEGIMSSTADFVAVMDGDLQHDETKLKEMLSAVSCSGDGGIDIAIGTRYTEGGSTGDWNYARKVMSKFANWIAHKITRVELKDPMSGFFLLRRDTFLNVVEGLSGLGFKILLDILTTSKSPLKVAEIPYTFRVREAGESKLDALAAWDFTMLLIDKRLGQFVPARFVSFACVGSFGIIVHFLVLTLGLELGGLVFNWAHGLAAAVSMVSNYWLNNLLTYRDRRRRGRRWFSGLISFMAVCSLGGVANIGIASVLYSSNTHWLLSALAGVIIGAVWNYAATALYTWRN